MEIINYIKWTKPGEKEKFIDVVKQSSDNNVLQNKLMEAFGIERYQANIMMLNFSEKINNIRNNKD